MSRRTFLRASIPLTAGVCAATRALPVWAQAGTFPSKTIRFVVPYASGGLPDTVARQLAQRLADRLGQQIIVENRPGANGVVAAQALSSSPPDGHTLLVTDSSMLSINPVIYKGLPYDPQRDFIPVSLTARAPLFLAVHKGVPANTLQDLIALAKAKPGGLNYGSSGIGSTHHLSMEAMKAALKLDIVHVPFKGTGQSVPALIGEQVDMVFSALPSLAAFTGNGQAKLLAVNSIRRSSQAPDVPALSELIPKFDFAPMIGVLAPKGTPADVVQRLSTEIAQLAKTPEFSQRLLTSGIDAVGGSADEYVRALREDAERSAAAVRSAGVKTE